MKLQDYKKLINNVTTKEELQQISYKAFLQDENALNGKRSLYDKVINLCVQKEESLGIL